MGYYKNLVIETMDGLRKAANSFVWQAAPMLATLCDEDAEELVAIWESTLDDVDSMDFEPPMGRLDIGYARELIDALRSFVIITTENDW